MSGTPGKSVVILGATGAVGTEVMRTLAGMPEIRKVTVLTRRPFTAVQSEKFDEHIVDPLDPESYTHLLSDHDIAICTLGVGGVSSVSKEEFLRVDRDAVIAFGQAVKEAGYSALSVTVFRRCQRQVPRVLPAQQGRAGSRTQRDGFPTSEPVPPLKHPHARKSLRDRASHRPEGLAAPQSFAQRTLAKISRHTC